MGILRNESEDLYLNPGSVASEFRICIERIGRHRLYHRKIHTVYLVADDFKTDRVWREVDYGETDLETVIQDLLSGQYNNPARVVAFNTAEHWSQDVSVDVAHELRRRCDLEGRDIPFFLQDFTDQYEGRYRDSSHRCRLREWHQGKGFAMRLPVPGAPAPATGYGGTGRPFPDP